MRAPADTLGALPAFLLYVAALLVLTAVGALTAGLWRVWRARPRTPKLEPETVQMTCSVCQRRLVFSRADLDPLSPPEMALVVRSHPHTLRRPLAEYVCPYCEAAHCFATDAPRVEWIGVNIYQPQNTSAQCCECRRVLARPPGGPSGTTQRVEEPAALPIDYGLKCPHCGSVCCVECCRKAARGRVTDGSFRCPRCFRKPVDRLYFP